MVGTSGSWGFPGFTVAFTYVAYGWAKNIEADGSKVSGDPTRPGKYGYNIGVGRSYRVVVRDSYAHGSADQNPGGQAYGIVVGAGSSACWVENSISIENNKPITMNSTGGMSRNLRAVGMDGWTHYHAYVGNVLKGGTVYEANPSSKGGTPI
jgi:hypothetical protein